MREMILTLKPSLSSSTRSQEFYISLLGLNTKLYINKKFQYLNQCSDQNIYFTLTKMY